MIVVGQRAFVEETEVVRVIGVEVAVTQYVHDNFHAGELLRNHAAVISTCCFTKRGRFKLRDVPFGSSYRILYRLNWGLDMICPFLEGCSSKGIFWPDEMPLWDVICKLGKQNTPPLSRVAELLESLIL
ncbi:hypothetical protein D3C71_1700860 [compost metagenome]